jgi:hypothetical protein
MAKRKETIEIENILNNMCKEKRIYGCEEVTIGFYNNGHGNEVVDFCTMDSKGILRCYEIKVTLADLKSKAKKSWYGHYNYLFVTRELYNKICNDLDKYIPAHVGVMVLYDASWSSGIQIVKNPKRQEITKEQEAMLKESMIRSMYYKMDKYREASDIQTVSKLKSDLRKSEKERKQYWDEASTLRFILGRIERALRLYYGKEVDLGELMQLMSIRKIKLPETISLELTERGRKYNEQVKVWEEIEED